MLSHASPEKHQSLSSSFGWLSPMGQMDCLSPGESRLSFSMSSPPYHGAEEVETPVSFVKLCDTLNSTISPSIFSPQEKRGLKLLKKRDYYQRDLMPGDNFLLLNDKMSGENSSSAESAPAPVKSEPQPPAPEPMMTKSHSLRNYKKNATTPVAVSHPVITPETVSYYKDSSAANTRKSSKHNIISPDIPLEGASKSLIMSSPAASSVSCNCKKSKCLKLYCDCFATLSYCNANACNCADCANNSENEILRQEAIKVTKDRNAFAFRTKISQKQEHAAGCRCKNSHCLKKYCECFTGNAFCGNNCKCLTCLNYSGSTALDQVRHTSRDHSSALITRERSPLKSPVGKGGSIFLHPSDDHQLLSCLTTLKSPTHNFLGLLSPGTGDHSGLSDDSALMLEENSSPLATSLVLRSSNGSSSGNSGCSNNGTQSKSKKNRVKFATVPVSYPFFGEHLPSTTKIISLKVLDYLNSKDIYSMAQVNSMWSIVAFDDALWE